MITKTDVRIHSLVRIFSVVWLLVACNFGGSLFFSVNSNIMNPNVSLWPPIIKDAVWLILLVLAIRFYSAKPRPELLIITGLTCAMLVAYASGVLVRDGFNIPLDSIKSIKNAALYMWAPLLLASFVDLRYESFIRVLMAVLFATLLVSVSLYLLVEADYKPIAPDLRMFGSTGNPNTASLLSVLLFILVSACFDKMRFTVRRVYLLVTFFSLYLSASYLYLLVLIMVMLYFTALGLLQGEFKKSALYWVETVLIAGVAWQLASYLVGLAGYPGIPLDLRFRSAIVISEHTGLESSDSIRIRLQDLQQFSKHNGVASGFSNYRQYDSAFLSYLRNFGLVGLLFVITPYVATLLLMIRRRVDWRLNNHALHICMLIIASFFLSGLVHYQISHFPSNVLMYLLFGFSLRELLTQAKSHGESKTPLQ